jgi:tripartite-type tricarboxylate transporter receptor subunit TctC
VATIEKAEGVKFTHITFPGDPEVATAILGGHIPFGLPHYGTVKSQMEAGDIRMLAVYLQKRLELLPEVPTFAELGYKIPYYPYLGVFAPKGTSDAIVKKLDRAIEKVKDDAAFAEKIRDLGVSITYESAESFRNNIVQYKANIEALFKELGYIKQ